MSAILLEADEKTRRSNARMLRWSDGSVSLQLGSDLFDVAPSHGATLSRPSDPQPATVTGPSHQPEAPSSNSSTTFLCLAAPAEAVLVTDSAVAGQLSLVPTSMTSKTHLELAKHVGQQHVKHSRMKILDERQDPAKHNDMLFKLPGAKPKASRSRTGGKSRKKRGMSDESEHDREREFADSSRSKRVDEGEYDEDDGFVVADSDDEGENTDEAAYGSSKKRRTKSKGRKRKGSEEPDEMEQAERRIEERERERKRVKKDSVGVNQKKTRADVGSDQDAEGEEEMEMEMEMDVESEED